jgi:hypothetical protein
MDILLKLLRKEETKLAGRLSNLRAAIDALAGNGTGRRKRGGKLSMAHRLAIKRGIAKAKTAKAR